MKRMSIAFLILALILGVSLLNGVYLGRTARTLNILLAQSCAAVSAGNWEQAMELTTQAEDQWESQNTYHRIVLHHETTDEIETGFSEAKAYIRGEDDAEALGALEQLAERLSIMAEMEQPRLASVF